MENIGRQRPRAADAVSDIQARAPAPQMAGNEHWKNPNRKYSFSGGRRRPP
jgi:hypothetical protein